MTGPMRAASPTGPLPYAVSDLSTSVIADACRRLGVGLRIAPPSIHPLMSGQRLIGRVVPVRYSGSMDAFLEAIDYSEPSDVLVVDNRGRLYEGCIGYLAALELMTAGITGAVVWGAHRDTDEIARSGFALFSCGPFPGGPHQSRQRHPESLSSARVGTALVTRDDAVVGDADGVLFVPRSRLEDVLQAAGVIASNQNGRAGLVRRGTVLREQFAFSEYLEQRLIDPTYTLEKHLRQTGEGIE
jgi:4-hydroxy-4-methyl-2-oxoglutarate aldolase